MDDHVERKTLIEDHQPGLPRLRMFEEDALNPISFDVFSLLWHVKSALNLFMPEENRVKFWDNLVRQDRVNYNLLHFTDDLKAAPDLSLPRSTNLDPAS